MTKIYGGPIENEAAYNRAIHRNIISNAQKTFRAKYPDAEEIESLIASGRTYDERGDFTYKDGFMGSMARAFDTYGKLTERQVEACRKISTDRAVRRAEWAAKEAALNASRRWLGEVGDKITTVLTLRKVVEIERPKFSYYDSGVSYLHILEDAEKNVVIYMGTAKVFDIEEGQDVNCSFTVKECGVRNGVKQTTIKLPKAAKV